MAASALQTKHVGRPGKAQEGAMFERERKIHAGQSQASDRNSWSGPGPGQILDGRPLAGPRGGREPKVDGQGLEKSIEGSS